MARYTTELRTICESIVGLVKDVGLAQTYDVIAQARPLIFDFDYPIFDDAYKSVLETKIIEHFYFREIGLENYGKFKFFLARKMREIMPYYNQLYKSELITFNPLYDVDINRKHNRKEDETGTDNGTRHDATTTTSTTNTNTNTTGNTGTAFSDTPQGQIDDAKNLKYLTTYTSVNDTNTEDTSITNDGTATSDGTTANTRVNKSTEDYYETVTGKQGSGSYSSMLIEFRETFMNIDMQVIDELSELFMNIY